MDRQLRQILEDTDALAGRYINRADSEHDEKVRIAITTAGETIRATKKALVHLLGELKGKELITK